MSASSTEPLWTPFTHGYVFWGMETAEHHPPGPDDIEGLREWLKGFMQAFADYPDGPASWIDPSVGESFTEAIELLCALDGALVEAGTATLLPGVRERLSELQACSSAVVIVTNQGGVGYRYAHEQRGDQRQAARYPTLEDVRDRLAAIAVELPITHIYLCLHHGRRDWPIPEDLSISGTDAPAPIRWTWRLSWRKPQPGMLLQALADLGAMPSETLMIGARPEDQVAALAANVPFQWAEEGKRDV